MTITQYNSNNSLAPEFKWTSFEKWNNLDKLISIPTKAEEISMIENSYKTGTIRNTRQKLQLIHDSLCFWHPPIRLIYRKNPQSVSFLKPNSSIPKPIHPPLLESWNKSCNLNKWASTIATSKGKDQNTLLRTAGVVQACHNFLWFLQRHFGSRSRGPDLSFLRWRRCYKSHGSFSVYLASEVQKWSNAPVRGPKLATKVSKSDAILPYVPRVNSLGWPLISALFTICTNI